MTMGEAASAGATPRHATVQWVACGGHGAPSQDGQCCEQGSLPTACPVSGTSDGVHANATVGSPANRVAMQPSRADRIRRRSMQSAICARRPRTPTPPASHPGYRRISLWLLDLPATRDWGLQARRRYLTSAAAPKIRTRNDSTENPIMPVCIQPMLAQSMGSPSAARDAG